MKVFAPTLHKPSLLTLFAVAVFKAVEIDQMDVMNPPEGFPPTVSGHVWKLKKSSIYSLKQAVHMWYQKLRNTLETLRYVHTTSDHAVFVH